MYHPVCRRAPLAPSSIWRRPLGDFPDIHVTIEDIIAEGEKVVVRNTWRVTDQESQQRIEFGGIVIWRISQGKLAEPWAYLQARHPIH